MGSFPGLNWREPEIPERFRKAYDRGRTGKAKDAIRAMCGMCCGWESAEVAKCTATGCPLYNLRNKAVQATTEEADRTKRRERAKASGARPPSRRQGKTMETEDSSMKPKLGFG